MNFAPIDWLILAVYLIATGTIGLWVRRYVEDLAGYVVAGRNVKTSLGVATFAATEMGTITFMYYGELGYVSGFACFAVGILTMIAYVTVGRTGFIIARLRAYGIMTIPEFYELRFSRRVRIVGGVILFLGGVLNMGIFFKFDGIFLSEVIGFGPEALTFIMTLMFVIVVSYTVLGGMLSVVVTDFMQYVVLSLGMLVATAFLLLDVDLPAVALAVTQEHGEGGYNPVEHPSFGWTFLVWVLISNIAAAALWQPGASRALASESPRTAKRIFWISGVTFAGRAMIPMFWGICAFAVLGPGQDSAAAMPRLLAQVVPVGFLGLMVAGMLAASMSTYSSYLLAWSSVLTLDVINALRPGGYSERTVMLITRSVSAIIGLFLLVFGLFYQIPDTAYQYLFITGAMYTAGALGCVVAGLYWKRASVAGAYGALLLGALAPAGFLILESYADVLPDGLRFIANVNVSGLLSFVLAAAGMVVGSLIFPRDAGEPPLRLPGDPAIANPEVLHA